MKKVALLLVILLLVSGSLVTAAEEVKVPFDAIKPSCYGEIDMTKAEFLYLRSDGEAHKVLFHSRY